MKQKPTVKLRQKPVVKLEQLLKENFRANLYFWKDFTKSTSKTLKDNIESYTTHLYCVVGILINKINTKRAAAAAKC